MTKEPAAAEVDFKKLTEYILNSYLNSCSEEDMAVLKLLDESMSVIGTGKQEFFRNLQEFSKSFLLEVEQREKIRFRWKDFTFNEQEVDAEHMLVYGTVLILGAFPDSDVCIRMDSRFTILYGLVDGIWKVQHIHHSVPDKEQMENEEFPRTLGQQIEESQSMIAALTADYLNVYVVEPEANQGTILKLDGYEVDGIEEKPKNFAYSTMLRRYAEDRVCDEDRTAFLQIFLPETLIQSFADGRERLELNYRVPENGGLKHYSGLFIRISKKTEPLKLIAGFRCTEDIITIQSKTRKEGMYSAYKAVSDLYLAMFRINIKENTYASIKTTEAILKHTIPDSDKYDENLKAIMTALADEESLASVLDFLDMNTIKDRMRGKKHIFIYFNGKAAELCKLHLIKEDSDADGNLNHVILAVEVLEEVTRERQEKDKALAEQFAIIDTLAKNFKNVFIANLNSGTARIVRLADDYDVRAVLDVMGKEFPFDSVVKQWIQENVYPDDKEKVAEAFKLENLRRVFSERDEYNGTYRSTEGGRLHHYQYDFRKADDNGNVVAGFQVIDAIVEEHEQQAKREKEQQEVLSHALAAAQQANKAKTTFLNSMSHDIRTPMNAIVGFTALAQTHSDDQTLVQDYLGKISTSSTHLLSLINDILDMSRIESGTVKLQETEVHIPDLLHDLRTMIQSLIKAKNQNLFIDTQDVVHENVLTDKLRLNQVLLNIVGNAIKFTQPGGDIMIRLSEKPCHLKNHTTYEFSVKDNGIGMSKEFVGHIFDTFSREYTSTVSGIQGTGLGMAISKNIVDMMGGDIRVESEVGKGSLFTVTLNLRIGREFVKNEPIPELLGAKALIVDDNMDTCRSVSRMLRDIQMRPDWTTSGKEAIVRAQDAAEMMDEYKVYIIDYLMPDMNGIETVRRIRNVISEDVPIIVLTAYDWADFESEARQAGVTAFVSKPIFMSELRTVLTRPAVKDGAESLEAEKEKKRTYDYSGKRALLVEDNALNREIATALLEEAGMKVDCVDDGDVAVSTINNAPADQYDLIFMDIQMPKMDGYTATREIRTLSDNRKANIPIIAMTANAFEEDKRKSYESGMNGHIIKPISMEAIAKVLDGIFAQKE